MTVMTMVVFVLLATFTMLMGVSMRKLGIINIVVMRLVVVWELCFMRV